MNGFCDLRPGHAPGPPATEDAFWPSFADLMMVVVVIFLLTSSALAVRNWQLGHEMDTALAAERQAREQAQRSQHSHDSAAAQLDSSRAALGDAQRRAEQLTRQLADAQESLRAVQLMRTALQARQTRQASELQASHALAAQLREQLAAQTQRGREADEALAAQRQQLQTLRGDQRQSGLTLQAERAASARVAAELAQLRADYAALKNRYDKLLQPARSSVDKHVVSLRHGRRAGALFYDIRAPGESDYTRVDEAEMHRRLAALLADQGDRLYLKLIYPRASGLSYEEAFAFRNSVLGKYDYYYRQRPAAAHAPAR